MKEYFGHFMDRELRKRIIFAVVFVVLALVVNFYAGTYATEKISNPVTDVVLSNTPVYNLDWIFIFGSWFLFLSIAYLAVSNPKKAPYLLSTVALFIIIRAIFFSVTHIAPYPTIVNISKTGFLSYFVFGGDLFFSGHTGLPFLMALVYWRELWLRNIFLATSLLMAVVVLLTHLHYTIDVLSAWFISYGIYKITEKAFKEDRFRFFQA